MKKILLCCLLLMLFMSITHAKNYLFNKGETDFSIVVSSEASTSEQTAATELQKYLRQISNAEFSLSKSIVSSKKNIYIGWCEACGSTRPSPDDESFTYRTVNGNLYIWGGSDRGTMYGVFSFLENELGVRWYTSDYTKIPQKKAYVLPSLNHTEKPYIEHRLDFYHLPLTDAVWCAHNKMNDQNTVKKNNYGGTTAIYGMHTMFTLVPPETYFAYHPEYYSLRNGKRQSEAGQLCLSNPDVLVIVKKNILNKIKEHPDYWVYDVSQMDNQNYCQCENCTKIANQYGGQSGLMIWFVNQVADAVKKTYPDKKISTFAYQYTRHAPTGIKPRDNVVIRLCDIECCFSHALEDETCEKNNAFMDDLKAWGEVSRNIYIWDYVVNFFGYIIPYPNFYTLGPNIKTFAENNVIGVMEEGQHDAPWGDFSEMRTWVISKLLWNPKQNVDILVKEFCDDYYGTAASDIYKYYKLYQSVPRDAHVIFSTKYYKECYDDEFLEKADNILSSAIEKTSNNPEVQKRVKRVWAQVLYLHNIIHSSKSKIDGKYDSLKKILRSDPTKVREGKDNLDENLKEQGYT